VLEQNKRYAVNMSAKEIIENSCLYYGSSYEGRKDAVKYRTDFRRKLPIPISISRNIYAFPTHSPDDYKCAWIFHRFIKCIIPDNSPSNREPKTTIMFDNSGGDRHPD
jgi:competence protein ComK